MRRGFIRSVVAICTTLTLILAMPSTTLGYSHIQASMSANNNGIGDWDMDFCFEYGTPPYNNQGAAMSGLAHWAAMMTHLSATIANPGDADNCWGANVEIRFDNIDPECDEIVAQATGLGMNDTFFTVQLNSQCGPWWYGGVPVPTGYLDAPTIIAHELGHGLGLGHTQPQYLSLMTSGYCHTGFRITVVSNDDKLGLQTWYPAWAIPVTRPTYATCST